ARLKTGFGRGIRDGRAVGQAERRRDGANLGRGEVGNHGLADEPHDAGEREGEENVEGRAGDEDEELRNVVDGWEFFHVRGVLALDGTEVGELREEHVAAERDPREAVFDTVLAAPRPDRRTEADREALDVRAAAAGGKEMAEFVDEDRPAEKEHDEEERPGI